MNAANTILSVFAVLVAAWAWLSARNARDGVAKVLRLLNARVGKLVDEVEGRKPPTFRQVPPIHKIEGDNIVPVKAVEEAPGNRGGSPSGREPRDETIGSSGRASASPRPPQGGGKQGPSQQTRELAAKAKEILAKRGDVSPADLRDGLGLTIKGFAKVRALLNADPDVVVYGETKSRRYKLRDGAPTAAKRQRIAAESAADGRSPGMPGTPGPKRDRQQPTIDGQVMSSIQLVPKSASAIAQERNLALDVVVPALRRLEAEGDVRRHESGNWVAVP